jgi:hypothetical protein
VDEIRYSEPAARFAGRAAPKGALFPGASSEKSKNINSLVTDLAERESAAILIISVAYLTDW